MIRYLDSSNAERLAMITFNHEKINKKFDADLRIWDRKILRPIRPSVVIQKINQYKPHQIKNTTLTGTIINDDCKVPLDDYESSWTKYLNANPSVG